MMLNPESGNDIQFEQNAFNMDIVIQLAKNEYETYKKYMYEIENKYKDDTGRSPTKEKLKELQNLEVSEYEKLYPKTIEYISRHIFKAKNGKYFIVTRTIDGFITMDACDAKVFMEVYGQHFMNYNGSEPYKYMIPIGKWLKKNTRTYTLTSSTMHPRWYEANGQHYLNMFDGFKYSKTGPRDMERIERGKAGIEVIKTHIKEVLCSNNEDQYNFFMNWIYKLVSGYKCRSAIYLKSKMGCGKSYLVEFLYSVIGIWNFIELSSETPIIDDNQNACLIGKSLVVLNELESDNKGYARLYNQLKSYLTEDTRTYRVLFQGRSSMQNISSFFLTGQHDMFKMESEKSGKDRRVFAPDVCDTRRDKEYCHRYNAACKSADVQYAFYYYCLDNMNPEWIDPATEGEMIMNMKPSETLEEMKIIALDTITDFLKYSKDDPWVSEPIKPAELYQYYYQYCSREKRTASQKNNFSKDLKKKPYVIVHKNKRLNGQNPTTYYEIDRKSMIKHFTENKYWTDFDDVAHDETSGTVSDTMSETTSTSTSIKDDEEAKIDERMRIFMQIGEYITQCDAISKDIGMTMKNIDELNKKIIHLEALNDSNKRRAEYNRFKRKEVEIIMNEIETMAENEEFIIRW